MWETLTYKQKFDIVSALHTLRESLKRHALRLRHKKKKKVVKPITFENPELAQIFEKMPEECKNLVRGYKDATRQ